MREKGNIKQSIKKEEKAEGKQKQTEEEVLHHRSSTSSQGAKGWESIKEQGLGKHVEVAYKKKPSRVILFTLAHRRKKILPNFIPFLRE